MHAMIYKTTLLIRALTRELFVVMFYERSFVISRDCTRDTCNCCKMALLVSTLSWKLFIIRQMYFC